MTDYADLCEVANEVADGQYDAWLKDNEHSLRIEWCDTDDFRDFCREQYREFGVD